MRATAGSSTPSRYWLLGLALMLTAGDAPAERLPTPPTGRALARPSVVCEATVQHPLQVHVVALDPILRGNAVRLRLTASSRVGLAAADARIVSPGGTTVIGPARAALDRMTADRAATTEFTVQLPATGSRFLVQFRVEGKGPAGRVGRGAAFNLLPDGPTAPTRIVAGSAGQPIAEYPARSIAR